MRIGKFKRKSKETSVTVSVNIDGKGKTMINTGVNYLNHILVSLGTHSMIDINISAKGDLVHHIVEDVAICLGEALKKALGNRQGITRFGHAIVPMDDALAYASIDLVKRSFTVVNLKIEKEGIEDMPREDIYHFIHSLSSSIETNIHLFIEYGENDHHKVEAAFKALALSLRQSISFDSKRKGIPSSKGIF
jgi:imidazoleglycerol-phosphate dehydratase